MNRLLEELRKYKARDDRGIMANLRCILVENKKHRAWPALNRLGVPIKEDVSAFIAGLFATHPEETYSGNFGTTCRAIKQRRGDTKSDDSKLTPTERRFQHLLAAERGEELYARILRMVLMAKAEGVPVNYERLANDLKKKDDWRKTEWAASFWVQGERPETEEEL
jgi:CRISPR system Cascade subunit CasB